MTMHRTRKSKRDVQATRIDQRNRDYYDREWETIKGVLQTKLSSVYPNSLALEKGPTNEQLAAEWANHLIERACHAVSLIRWIGLNTPKDQLKIEQKSLLLSLKAARTKLDQLSPDFRSLLGSDRRSRLAVNAEVLDCHNRIKELIQRVDAAGDAITRLPKVKKTHAVEHEAAVELAIVVLPELKKLGMSIGATETGRAVDLLRFIGDCLGLRLDLATWKAIIIEAKKAPQAIWRISHSQRRVPAELR